MKKAEEMRRYKELLRLRRNMEIEIKDQMFNGNDYEILLGMCEDLSKIEQEINNLEFDLELV